MARKYEVKGTRAYLYWSIGLLLLGLYAVWDAWFPRASVLEVHPSPEDAFYMFNKILAVIALVGAAIAGYIHTVVR